MTLVAIALVLAAAAADAQDLQRTPPPNLAERPAALATWRWPDCTQVLAGEAGSFAEAMCRAAQARNQFRSATDIVDGTAATYRLEALGHFRRAVNLAASPLEKRAALAELALIYSSSSADVAQAALAWRDVIGIDPGDQTGYLALARLQHNNGARKDEETTLQAARQAVPASRDIVEALTRLYASGGSADDAVRTVREFAEQNPADAKRHWLVATWYWQLQNEPAFAARAAEFTTAGLRAIDTALTIDPDSLDALTCKYSLLRREADLAKDPVERQAALTMAQQVRARILELRR